ncbi:hypothetical protein SAMN05444267_100561 [Chryseobacterium polytrichastri]|uniref:Uncharacterized protein n=1 Tax=Chryseobacterium polytrichastri TaxID=1302687 RepID=A0A1M6TDE9_9FLAO|nr:hypothetical protein SAMN05444267_100561 [Chryseobacterium polytrichastri]
MKNIAKFTNVKLINRNQLKQIMGGRICACGTPCPDMNQPPPKPCN